jgi:hypothetical protein
MEATTDEVWFVLLQGEELGPLSFEDVLDFYYKDLVSSESMLWREGWSDWVQIIQVPEFNELLLILQRSTKSGALGAHLKSTLRRSLRS